MTAMSVPLSNIFPGSCFNDSQTGWQRLLSWEGTAIKFSVSWTSADFFIYFVITFPNKAILEFMFELIDPQRFLPKAHFLDTLEMSSLDMR